MAEHIRAGRFRLPADVVFDRCNELGEFFARFVIFRAEQDHCSRTIIYDAISDDFAPIKRGEKIPEYEIDVSFRTVERHYYDGYTVKRLP